ncbi:MAG: hypothetical protein LUH54_02220 [Firmicutes bacterium]|nr:hypothetical protein [Bacillota bacterium]
MKKVSLTAGGGELEPFGNIKYTSRRGLSPSTISFECGEKVEVGGRVEMSYGGKMIFVGRIFTVTEAPDKYTALAYDMMRYLENRDTIELTGRTASEVISIIALSYGFPIGKICGTEYRLGQKCCEMKTLSDIIEASLSLTEAMGGERYVLFDDCGSLSLLPEGSLIWGKTLSRGECASFEVTASIDEDFYDEVMLYIDEDGGRQITLSSNEEAKAKYGLSRYTGKLSRAGAGYMTAGEILGEYSFPKISVKCTVLGDGFLLRGGMSVPTLLEGKVKTLFCERAEHIFSSGGITSKLELSTV